MQYQLSKECSVLYKTEPYDDTLPVESHDYFEIYVYESGNIAYMVEDLHVDMYPGYVIIIPPGRMHRTFPVTSGKPNRYKRYLINISSEYIASLGGSEHDLLLQFRTAYHLHGNVARFDESAFEELKLLLSSIINAQGDENGEKGFRFRTLISYFFFRLMTQLSESKFPRMEHMRSVQKKYKSMPGIIRYINENLTEPLSLEDIAEEFHISPSYMAHCFKEYTGISMYRYIRNKRIILSRKLIASGMSVVRAQQQCGIIDYPNFYRAFFDFTGMSPLQYRKTVCKNK